MFHAVIEDLLESSNAGLSRVLRQWIWISKYRSTSDIFITTAEGFLIHYGDSSYLHIHSPGSIDKHSRQRPKGAVIMDEVLTQSIFLAGRPDLNKNMG
jgi:hypothetical protein